MATGMGGEKYLGKSCLIVATSIKKSQLEYFVLEPKLSW
jgi:hypothetical protein